MSNFDPDAPGAGVGSMVFTPTVTTVGANDYVTITGLNPGTKYYITVYAVDKYGTRSEKKYYSGTTAN